MSVFTARGKVFIGGKLIGRNSQFKVTAGDRYVDRLQAALKVDGDRYMEAWWCGTNPRLSSGKAKRVTRLMRYLARAKRLEGML